MTLWDILCGLAVVTALTLVLGWWMNGYFRRRGIKSPTAYLPFIGHMQPVITKQMHFRDFIQNLYKSYPEEKYIGVIEFTQRMLVVRDMELIKQITIKDFDHFLNHVSSFEEDTDIFANSLFSLRGQKWRDMRATLSPAFTSSKMRGMFQFIVDCGQQMTDYYIKQLDSTENKVRGLVEVEMKDAFTRYTNDVIATAAFGLQVDSFTKKENTFYLMGKKVTDFSGVQFFKFFIMVFIPALSKLFNLRFVSEEITNFYRNLVWDTVKYRKEQNIVRPDMIHLLMETRKGTLKHDSRDDNDVAGFAAVHESAIGKSVVKRDWTDDDIVAQAFIFFVAGFETSATLLCFMVHELAYHPKIQRKLQEEIDEVYNSLDGKLTYDRLLNMKYMDMVVSETLRLWPPAVLIDRKCSKAYDMPPARDGGVGFQMKEGDGIWIPIYAIHRDPKFWKNPDNFEPERFSDENKDQIDPNTFLPFGIGPRNCIGSRFALMEAKSVIFHLLRTFDIVPTAKSYHDVKLKLDSFNLINERGFWVGLKPRTV